MQRLSLSILFAAVLAGCSGGAATTPQVAAVPTTAPTTVATTGPAGNPTTAPTTVPTTAPSIAPTLAPTASPTPVSLKVIGGAPLSATASQLAAARRSAQAHTTAQGITNGVPILVESTGIVALWAGNFVNWVTNAATSQDVPQTSGTITTTGNLLVNNPGFTQACVGSLAAACIVHPTAWEFGTDSGLVKPLGKQTLTIAFGDGTTAQTFDYIYNGWSLACNSGWVYSAGLPVANAVKATSDVYADCVAGNIVFPKGGMLYSNPVQDQYGRPETIFPTITTAFLLSSPAVNFPMTSIGIGGVYVIATQDGGFAKVYFTSGASATTVTSATGMALHANPDGTYPY